MTGVCPGIYIGNSQDAKEVAHGHHLHIKAVLNCAWDLYIPQTPDCVLSAAVHLQDGPGNNPQAYQLAIDFLLNMWLHKLPTLVHCHEGNSRSPAVVAFWLRVSAGKFPSLDAAAAYLKVKRPSIDINPGHLEIIRELLGEEGVKK